MEQIKTSLKRYLKETLDINVQPKKWEEAEKLPFFLRNLYAFYKITILSVPCLVMITKEETAQTPAIIHKHILQVLKKWPHEIIYVQPKVTAYNRKRLIEHKLPFVVPGNQMYLPFLGIDFREHFKKIHSKDSRLSPATQVVVLYALFYKGDFSFTPKELAKRLGYTSMTMTRVLNELEKSGFVTITLKGRERLLRFGRDKKALWEDARERLRDPVNRRLWVKHTPDRPWGIKAGLSALAYYSNLAEPMNPVFAVDGKRWKSLQLNKKIKILDMAETDSREVEIWSYAPELFATDGVADRFSLYLSLRTTEDERVEAALDEMMEQAAW